MISATSWSKYASSETPRHITRPSNRRRKYQYFGKPLHTRQSLIELFTDVNGIVLHLRTVSGNKERWEVIPPGYANEMGWNQPTHRITTA